MTDDKREQRRQSAKEAVQLLRDRPEAAALIERTLVTKWGEQAGGDFSREILRVNPDIIDAALHDVNKVFGSLDPPDSDQELENRRRGAMGLVEILYCRAFLAHIVNRVKDVEETPENFYTEYYRILPYLEKIMQTDPDAYSAQELDIYNRIELSEVVALWSKKEATGPESHMLMAAIRAADDDERRERRRERQKEFSRITYKDGFTTRILTDKLFSHFYSHKTQEKPGHENKKLTPAETVENGSALKYEGKGKPITLNYDFSVDGAQLKAFGVASKFDYYDAFVAVALDNLYEEGNTSPTLTKIWHEMGNTGNPTGSQLVEIFKSLIKSDSTTMLSNAPEVLRAMTKGSGSGTFSKRRIVSVNFENISYRVKDGELSIAGGNVVINGQSIFYELGSQLKHMTAFKKEFLQMYKGRKTRRFYSVLYFLITQIEWMRNENSKRGNKITYKKLYEMTGATEYHEKRQVKDMMFKILDQMFIPAGHVIRYKEVTSGEPGVTLTYTRASRLKG